MIDEPRRVDKPVPGFYRLRLAKGGPSVAARISYGPPADPETSEPLDRSWYWRAEINGRLIADPSPDPIAAGVPRVWHYGQPIDEAEYRFLLADVAWQQAHAGLDPKRAVNIREMAPVLPPGRV